MTQTLNLDICTVAVDPRMVHGFAELRESCRRHDLTLLELRYLPGEHQHFPRGAYLATGIGRLDDLTAAIARTPRRHLELS